MGTPPPYPKPQRRDFYRRTLTGRWFNQSAYDDAVAAWRRRCEEARGQERQRREATREDAIREYDKVTDRPEGVLEAGNTTVDGNPGYYEDGGSTGQSGRRERYSGPNGPLGDDHHHDSSTDGGRTWWRWH